MNEARVKALRIVLAAVVAVPCCVAAQTTEPVQRPAIATGDQWVMRKIDLWTSRESGRLRTEVVAVGELEATVLQSPVGATGGEAPQRRSVDIKTWTLSDAGRFGSSVEFAFPLVVGKKWSATFKTSSPNPNYQIPHSREAQVEGWETVTVPAGTFTALRVSYVDRIMLFIADGVFPAYVNETVWYAPAAKWYVKREETVRNPLKKIETQIREELVELKVIGS